MIHNRAAPATDGDPYAGSADVALLAARAGIAAERAASGAELEDIDRELLIELADQFSSAADALNYIESHGRAGSKPTHYHSVGLAVEAVTEPDAPLDPEASAEVLSSLVDAVRRVLDEQDRDAARKVMKVTRAIARLALEDAGVTGDELATL